MARSQTTPQLTPAPFNPNVQLSPMQFSAGANVASPLTYADALKEVAQDAVNLTGTMEKAQNTSINFFKDAMEDLQGQLQPLAMDASEKNRMLQELAAGITALTALNQDMAEGKFDTQEKRDQATSQAHQFTAMLKEVTSTIAAKAPKEDKDKAEEQMRRFRSIDERRDTSIKYQQNLDARMMSQLMNIGSQFSEELKVLQSKAGTAAAKGTPEGQKEFEAIQVKINLLMENISKNASMVMTKTSEQQTNLFDKASTQLQSNVSQRAKEMARTWAEERKRMIAENFKAKTISDIPDMLDLDKLFGTLTESFSFGDIKKGFDALRGKNQSDADAAKAAETSAAELMEINNNIAGLRQDTQDSRRFYEKQVALYEDRQRRYDAAIDAVTEAAEMDAAQVEAYKKSAEGMALYQQAGEQAEAAFSASEQAKQLADPSYVIDNIKLVNAIDINGIPMLADGGKVKKNSIINVAENGSELVIPLEQVEELTDLSNNLISANNAANKINVDEWLASLKTQKTEETNESVIPSDNNDSFVELSDNLIEANKTADALLDKINKSRLDAGRPPILAERTYRNERERIAAEGEPEAIDTSEIPIVTPESSQLEREIIATRSTISELEKQLEKFSKKQTEEGEIAARSTIRKSFDGELSPEMEAFLVNEVQNVLIAQTERITNELGSAHDRLTKLIDRDIAEKKAIEDNKKRDEDLSKRQALAVPKFGPEETPIPSAIVTAGEENLEPMGDIAETLSDNKPGLIDSAKGTSAPISVGPINSKRTPEGRILQATIETGAAQWKKLDEIADLLRQKGDTTGKGKTAETKGKPWWQTLLDLFKNLIPLLLLLAGALMDPAAFLKGLFKWMPDFFKKFKDIWEKIAKKFGEFMDRLKFKLGEIKGRIKKFIEDFLEKFREIKGRIKQFFDDLFSGKWIENIKAKLSEIGNKIKKFFDDLFSGKLLEDLKKSFAEFGERMKKFFDDLFSGKLFADMKKSLDDFAGNISKTWSDFTSELKKTLKVDEIRKWFGDVFSMKTASEMKNIAMKWWTDLWSGDLARSLYDAARKSFDSALEKGKSGLKGLSELPGRAVRGVTGAGQSVKDFVTGAGKKGAGDAEEQLFKALMAKNPAATIARDDVTKYVAEFARLNKMSEADALTKLLSQAGVSTGAKVGAKAATGFIPGLARTVSHGVGTGAGFKAGLFRNIGFPDYLGAKIFNPNDEEGAAIDMGGSGLGGMIAGGTTRALGMNPARMGATGNAAAFLGNVWLQSAISDKAKAVRAKMRAGEDVTAMEKAQYYGTAGAGYAGETYMGGRMTMGALEQMRLAQAATQGKGFLSGFGAIGASVGTKGVQSGFGSAVGSRVAGPLASVFAGANIARNLGAFGEGAQDMDMKVAQETGDKFYQSMKIMNDIAMAGGSFFGPLGTLLGMGAGSLGMSAAMLRNPSINKEVAMREVVAEQQERKAKAKPFVESADTMRKKMREEGAAKGMDIVKIQEKLSRKEAVTDEERKYSEQYNKLYKITNVMTKAAEMNLKQTGANTVMQKLANMPDWATAATSMVPGLGFVAAGAKAYVGETKEPDKKAVYGATLDDLQKAFKEAIAAQDTQLAANIQGAMKTFVETNATQVDLSKTFSSAAVDMRSVLTENQNLTKQDTETFNKALDGLQKDAAKPMVAIRNAIDEIGKIQDVEARTDAYLKLQDLISKSGEGIDNQNQLLKKLDQTMNDGIGVDRDLIKTMKTMNKGPAEIKAEILQAMKGVDVADAWGTGNREKEIAKMEIGSKEMKEYVSGPQFAGLLTLIKDKGGMTETEQAFMTEQLKKKGYSDEAIVKILGQLEQQVRESNALAEQQKAAQEKQKVDKAARIEKETAAKKPKVEPTPMTPKSDADKETMSKINVAMSGTTPVAETIKNVSDNLNNVSPENRAAIIKKLNDQIDSIRNEAQRAKLKETLKTTLEKNGVPIEESLPVVETPTTPIAQNPATTKGEVVVTDPNSAKDSTAQETNSLLGQLVGLFKNFGIDTSVIASAAKIPEKAGTVPTTPGAVPETITSTTPPTTTPPAPETVKLADDQKKAAQAQTDAAEKQESLAKQAEAKADKEKQAIDKDVEAKLSKMDEMKESYLLKTVLGEDAAQMGIDVSAPLAEAGPEAAGAASILGIPQGELGKTNIPGIQASATTPMNIMSPPSASPSMSTAAQAMTTARMPSAENMTINNNADNKDDLNKVIDLLGKIAKNTADGGSNPPPPPAGRPNQTYRR